MALTPYNITLHAYARDKQEADELQDALRDFVIAKYNQGIYPRAASLTKLLKQYGNSPLLNAFLS